MYKKKLRKKIYKNPKRINFYKIIEKYNVIQKYSFIGIHKGKKYKIQVQVDGNKCKTAKLVETVFRRKIDLKCGKNSFNKKEKNVKMEKK